MQAGLRLVGCAGTIGVSKMSIEQTLQERGSRYGDFGGHARITQSIKRAMADSPNWNRLADDQKEALEMLAHKVGRILNGDADYHDHRLHEAGCRSARLCDGEWARTCAYVGAVNVRRS